MEFFSLRTQTGSGRRRIEVVSTVWAFQFRQMCYVRSIRQFGVTCKLGGVPVPMYWQAVLLLTRTLIVWRAALLVALLPAGMLSGHILCRPESFPVGTGRAVLLPDFTDGIRGIPATAT